MKGPEKGPPTFGRTCKIATRFACKKFHVSPLFCPPAEGRGRMQASANRLSYSYSYRYRYRYRYATAVEKLGAAKSFLKKLARLFHATCTVATNETLYTEICVECTLPRIQKKKLAQNKTFFSSSYTGSVQCCTGKNTLGLYPKGCVHTKQRRSIRDGSAIIRI